MAEHHECLVEGTPDEVFAYITDQSKLPEWNRSIVSSSVVGGPLAVGSKLEQVRQRGGKQMRDTLEVVDHDPPRRHRVRGEVMGFHLVLGFELEPAGSATKVTMGHKVRAKGLRSLFAVKVDKAMDAAERDAMAALPGAFAART